MTTDPIELWAAPESRSRVERKFFDETFRPFYRTEQIIIHAKNLERVSLMKELRGGSVHTLNPVAQGLNLGTPVF